MVISKRIMDLIERVGLTFLGAFIAFYVGGIVASGSTVNSLSNAELFDNALTAGVAAIVPLVTGLVGFKIGDKNTASIITAKLPEEPEIIDAQVPQESPAPMDNYSQEG